MTNEVLQWAFLVVLAILVLGVLRQISLMLPAQARAAESGPATGKRLPRGLLEEARRLSPDGRLADRSILAFVTEHCVGCQRLLVEMEDRAADGGGPEPIVVAKQPSGSFLEALRESGNVVIPIDDRTWDSCAVTATPLVLEIDGDGRVLNKEVTHHVDTFASAA